MKDFAENQACPPSELQFGSGMEATSWQHASRVPLQGQLHRFKPDGDTRPWRKTWPLARQSPAHGFPSFQQMYNCFRPSNLEHAQSAQQTLKFPWAASGAFRVIPLAIAACGCQIGTTLEEHAFLHSFAAPTQGYEQAEG